MKKGDKVIVPAIVNGYGIDITGFVTEIEIVMGRKLITVSYLNSDPAGRLGGCFFENQIILN